VAHCFVDILAVLHQHTLRPHAFFSPPGGTVQKYFLSPTHPQKGIPDVWAQGDHQGPTTIYIA
jgi:alkanesulfonate monooxygenase SsuD/methylene tetrahydromethanopterin reductase-like flavin-dependent oxidoreductase (luciferase family)